MTTEFTSQRRADSSRSVDGARGPANPPQRQRAMRLDVKISRQAMKAVLPTNQRIGPWQVRAAHLQVMAEKLSAGGRHDDKVAEEARKLLDTVKAQRQKLQDKMEALPAEVADSTRFDDTDRALGSVAAVLERTLALMPPRNGPPS